MIALRREFSSVAGLGLGAAALAAAPGCPITVLESPGGLETRRPWLERRWLGKAGRQNMGKN